MARGYLNRLYGIFSRRDFIWALSKKELRIKYSGSRLGIWWAMILPLLLALSISLIFTKAFKVSIPNYTLFVLSAILPWLFFSQGLSEATNSFLTNSSILKQGVFPKEVVPIASTMGNFLNFILGLVVIMPLFIIFNYRVIYLIPMAILSLVVFLVFLCGLGLILSSMNVFYRDVSCFLSLGLMIWFWITPVFYSLEMIPYPYRIIGLANPLTYFILNFRGLLYYGTVDVNIFVVNIFFALLFFLGGYHIFLSREKELSKRL